MTGRRYGEDMGNIYDAGNDTCKGNGTLEVDK